MHWAVLVYVSQCSACSSIMVNKVIQRYQQQPQPPICAAQSFLTCATCYTAQLTQHCYCMHVCCYVQAPWSSARLLPLLLALPEQQRRCADCLRLTVLQCCRFLFALCEDVSSTAASSLWSLVAGPELSIPQPCCWLTILRCRVC
jgi:hypothetical protein